jgi:hypothetical protein
VHGGSRSAIDSEAGEAKKEKQAKVATATDVWGPTVNNWGGAGRWAFLEVTDPWVAEHLIRARAIDRTSAKPDA